MASEAKRGCGYRKFGGLYIVCDPIGEPCDRLPIELSVCHCCGGGIKQARGYTWIRPEILFGTHHRKEDDPNYPYPHRCDCMHHVCPVCYPHDFFHIERKAGLLWVGEKYYTPEEFKAEVNEMGISKRIPAVPNDFKVGETWIFLAHPKAIPNIVALDNPDEPTHRPGIFMAVKPQRIERIVKQTEYNTWKSIEDERVEFNETDEWKDWVNNRVPVDLKKIYDRLQRDHVRGITLVPLPDGDPDHQ